jgi:hypothetical protein
MPGCLGVSDEPPITLMEQSGVNDSIDDDYHCRGMMTEGDLDREYYQSTNNCC